MSYMDELNQLSVENLEKRSRAILLLASTRPETTDLTKASLLGRYLDSRDLKHVLSGA